MDTRDGVKIEPLEPDLEDLLSKAGSSSYQPKKVDGVPRAEFLNHYTTLAPNESDGVDDQEEWNLFEQYLAMTFDNVEDLNDPHSLSDMLAQWEMDKVSCKPYLRRWPCGDSTNSFFSRYSLAPIRNA
jgi:hypothetical protein